MKNSRIRCISLWQPWASLMACGAKFLETRSWDTRVRGEVFIHASKTRRGIRELIELDDDRILSAMEEALKLAPIYWEHDLPFGAILACGQLSDTHLVENTIEEFEEQEPFGNFDPGRYAHEYRDLRSIVPIPFKGAQGFFFADVPRAAIEIKLINQ
ncbi:MAG: hypothetical protein AAFX93_14035 [Verrucomicrobiota bacterium]